MSLENLLHTGQLKEAERLQEEVMAWLAENHKELIR
jgi:hypothetical protein